MIAPSSTLYKVLDPIADSVDPIADSVDPILALIALAIAGIEWRRAKRSALAFMLATGASLAAIYAIQAIDRALHLWQRYGGDYSTHSAFAICIGISIVVWRRKWFAPIAAIVAGYLALIVIIGYHRIIDVMSASVVALFVTLPWHAAARRAITPPSPPHPSPPPHPNSSAASG